MAPCDVYSMPFTTVLFTTCYSCVTDFSRQRRSGQHHIVLWLWRYVFRYLCVNAAVGIGFSCGADTLARAAGQVKREH